MTFVNLAQMLVRYVRVHLRRRDRCVSEERLHIPELRAVPEEVGCVRVAERVWMDVLHDPCGTCVFFDEAFDGSGSERLIG